MQLQTKAPKAGETGADGKPVGRSITVEYNFGTNLDEVVALFGAESVANAAVAQYKIDLQAVIRGMLEDGKTDEEINAKVAEWKPGMKTERAPKKPASTEDLIKALFAGKTPEQLNELLNTLREKAAANAAA